MSDEQTPPPVEPQADAPKVESAPPPPQSQTVDLSELKTAVAGLPEAVANAIKEVLPQAPKQAPVRRETKVEKTETPAPVESAPAAPQQKTFRDWWFGN